MRPALITGGAGFIGTNLAHRLLSSGTPVTILDNLSRPGVEQNLIWLRRQHENHVQFISGDIRDRGVVKRALRWVEQVYHFAAQVAVTTSLENPRFDFEVNALGTLNVLEEIREMKERPTLLYTSTNKVYGALDGIGLERTETRYEPEDPAYRDGVDEQQRLDFLSPYGCSKGAADQYVLEYARNYQIPATVFRMSCIYGPHQFGTEDQGWVAHFLIRALEGQPITIYGDGMQVRDLLYVDDLVDAMITAQNSMEVAAGHAFNIGGGVKNALSLVELVRLAGELTGHRMEMETRRWRPGDQRYFTSNTSKFQNATGWSPKVDVRKGVELLTMWLAENRLKLKTPAVTAMEGVR